MKKTKTYILFLFFFASLNVFADDTFINKPEVQAFIQQMVKKDHFKKQQLVELFSAVKVRKQVIRHINKPLEAMPWHTYQMLFVNEWRIQHGVKFWNKYEAALNRAEKTFGVPASIIVATIGIETKYGRETGGYRVIDSLSTLAFSDSPRSKFFRIQLREFLLLTREQHLNPLTVMGSYAGAIGQPQFIPSSYRYYAINFSNSGKIDLSHDEVDVIGSIANYYKKNGWIPNQAIVVPANVIGDRLRLLTKNGQFNPSILSSQLAKYGIVPRTKIPKDQKVQIIELQNRYTKEYWVGLHDFNVIKRYNPSDLYAMAVFQLSDYLSAVRERLNGSVK